MLIGKAIPISRNRICNYRGHTEGKSRGSSNSMKKVTGAEDEEMLERFLLGVERGNKKSCFRTFIPTFLLDERFSHFFAM